MKISGSETAFDAWDEMSVFIVFQGDNISNWRKLSSLTKAVGYFL